MYAAVHGTKTTKHSKQHFGKYKLGVFNCKLLGSFYMPGIYQYITPFNPLSAYIVAVEVYPFPTNANTNTAEMISKFWVQ